MDTETKPEDVIKPLLYGKLGLFVLTLKLVEKIRNDSIFDSCTCAALFERNEGIHLTTYFAHFLYKFVHNDTLFFYEDDWIPEISFMSRRLFSHKTLSPS